MKVLNKMVSIKAAMILASGSTEENLMETAGDAFVDGY